MSQIYLPYERSEAALSARPPSSKPPLRDALAAPFRALSPTTYFMDGNHYIGALKDWGAYSANYPLVAWKVSEGTHFVDSALAPAMFAAKVHDLVFIGYHFLDHGVSGRDQANWFHSHFPHEPGRIACIDYEQDGLIPEVADEFIARIFELDGIYPWFYGHSKAMGVGFRKLWAACPYWGPTYGNSLTLPPSWAHIGAKAWQFTDGVIGPYPHSLTGVGRTSDVSKLLVPISWVEEYAGKSTPIPTPPAASNRKPAFSMGG